MMKANTILSATFTSLVKLFSKLIFIFPYACLAQGPELNVCMPYIPWVTPSLHTRTLQTHPALASLCRKTLWGCNSRFAGAAEKKEGRQDIKSVKPWHHTNHLLSVCVCTAFSSILWVSLKFPSECFSSFRITIWKYCSSSISHAIKSMRSVLWKNHADWF